MPPSQGDILLVALCAFSEVQPECMAPVLREPGPQPALSAHQLSWLWYFMDVNIPSHQPAPTHSSVEHTE